MASTDFSQIDAGLIEPQTKSTPNIIENMFGALKKYQAYKSASDAEKKKMAKEAIKERREAEKHGMDIEKHKDSQRQQTLENLRKNRADQYKNTMDELTKKREYYTKERDYAKEQYDKGVELSREDEKIKREETKAQKAIATKAKTAIRRRINDLKDDMADYMGDYSKGTKDALGNSIPNPTPIEETEKYKYLQSQIEESQNEFDTFGIDQPSAEGIEDEDMTNTNEADKRPNVSDAVGKASGTNALGDAQTNYQRQRINAKLKRLNLHKKPEGMSEDEYSKRISEVVRENEIDLINEQEEGVAKRVVEAQEMLSAEMGGVEQNIKTGEVNPQDGEMIKQYAENVDFSDPSSIDQVKKIRDMIEVARRKGHAEKNVAKLLNDGVFTTDMAEESMNAINNVNIASDIVAVKDSLRAISDATRIKKTEALTNKGIKRKAFLANLKKKKEAKGEKTPPETKKPVVKPEPTGVKNDDKITQIENKIPTRERSKFRDTVERAYDFYEGNGQLTDKQIRRLIDSFVRVQRSMDKGTARSAIENALKLIQGT